MAAECKNPSKSQLSLWSFPGGAPKLPKFQCFFSSCHRANKNPRRVRRGHLCPPWYGRRIHPRVRWRNWPRFVCPGWYGLIFARIVRRARMPPLYRHVTSFSLMAAKEKHRILPRLGTQKCPSLPMHIFFFTRDREGTTPKKLIAAKSSLLFLFLP